MKRETRGGAALCALALGWAGSAAAAPSITPGAPVVSNTPASDAPIELDTALEGATHGRPTTSEPHAVVDSGQTTPEQRPPALDGGRKRVNPVVLFSAADGVGVGGLVRSGVFGLQGTVAYQPLLFLVDKDPADKTFGAFEFANSIQLNVDAMLVGAQSETGGSIGYRFNNLLGHGVTLAYQSVFEMWGEHFSLSFPVTYYPAATSRVRDRLDIAPGYEINFPFGAGLQFGMGAAWVL
jgi:hypothetical protein